MATSGPIIAPLVDFDSAETSTVADTYTFALLDPSIPRRRLYPNAGASPGISALTSSGGRGNQSSKQLIKRPCINLPRPYTLKGGRKMGWIAALVTISAVAMLGVTLRRLEGDKGWRDQAEGLRERLGREGFPRA